MEKLVFSHKWVELFMRCISTPSFFCADQWGSKSCPLSPYLFIICADVCINILKQAESNQLIHGLKFSKDLSITHLLFADDSLVFTKATK